MARYRVGTSPGGSRVWWAAWELPHADMQQYSDVRDSTEEETALMDKIVWGSATPDDCRKVRELTSTK